MTTTKLSEPEPSTTTGPTPHDLGDNDIDHLAAGHAIEHHDDRTLHHFYDAVDHHHDCSGYDVHRADNDYPNRADQHVA